MEALVNYLLRFGNLNQQQIELVKSKGIVKEIKKMLIIRKLEKFPEKLSS